MRGRLRQVSPAKSHQNRIEIEGLRAAKNAAVMATCLRASSIPLSDPKRLCGTNSDPVFPCVAILEQAAGVG